MKIARLFSTFLLVAGTAVMCPNSNALSLAAVLDPHPAAAGGQKAELQIKNPNRDFRDLKIGTRVYTVLPNHTMWITAPVGTPIYAASSMFHKHAKGALIAQMDSGSHTLAVD